MAKGVVYFVEAEGLGLIKIGVTSRDFRHRLVQLRAQSPAPLRVLGVMSGGVEREREAHARFRGLWSHGEWFRADDSLRAFIAENAQPWEPPAPPVKRPIVSRHAGRLTVEEWARVTTLEFDGVTRTVAEWSELTGASTFRFKCHLDRFGDAEILFLSSRRYCNMTGRVRTLFPRMPRPHALTPTP